MFIEVIVEYNCGCWLTSEACNCRMFHHHLTSLFLWGKHDLLHPKAGYSCCCCLWGENAVVVCGERLLCCLWGGTAVFFAFYVRLQCYL